MYSWRLLLLSLLAIFQPISSLTERELVNGQLRSCTRDSSALRDSADGNTNIYRSINRENNLNKREFTRIIRQNEIRYISSVASTASNPNRISEINRPIIGNNPKYQEGRSLMFRVDDDLRSFQNSRGNLRERENGNEILRFKATGKLSSKKYSRRFNNRMQHKNERDADVSRELHRTRYDDNVRQSLKREESDVNRHFSFIRDIRAVEDLTNVRYRIFESTRTLNTRRILRFDSRAIRDEVRGQTQERSDSQQKPYNERQQDRKNERSLSRDRTIERQIVELIGVREQTKQNQRHIPSEIRNVRLNTIREETSRIENSRISRVLSRNIERNLELSDMRRDSRNLPKALAPERQELRAVRVQQFRDKRSIQTGDRRLKVYSSRRESSRFETRNVHIRSQESYRVIRGSPQISKLNQEQKENVQKLQSELHREISRTVNDKQSFSAKSRITVERQSADNSLFHDINERIDTSEGFSSINWHFLLYVVQGIYLGNILVHIFAQNMSQKKNRIPTWLPTGRQLLKVE